MGVSLYAAGMARPDSDHEHGTSLVQRAVDAVNAYMVEHDLRVGDSLPGEGHFAAELGVSRAVMREAFGALAALRLIDVGNGRRPRVGAIDGSVMAASMSHAISTAQITVAEVWDVRRTLELQTAAQAALNRSDAQAGRLVALAEAMAEDIDDMARVAAHDIAFHRAIAEASGDALMAQLVAADHDDAGAARVEQRGGDSLHGRGVDAADRGDVALQLVDRHALLDEAGERAGDAAGGLGGAPEAADQHRLARVELARRDRLGAHALHLGDDDRHGLRRAGVFGRGAPRDRATQPARREGTAGAISEAALDPDLLVQPRRIAATEHRVGDGRRVIVRAAARDVWLTDYDTRLAGAGHVHDDDARRYPCGRYRDGRGRARPAGGVLPGAEIAFRQRPRRSRRDVADQHQSRGTRVPRPMIGGENVAARDRL